MNTFHYPTENYSKKPVFRFNKSRHCAYKLYSVKTQSLKMEHASIHIIPFTYVYTYIYTLRYWILKLGQTQAIIYILIIREKYLVSRAQRHTEIVINRNSEELLIIFYLLKIQTTIFA